MSINFAPWSFASPCQLNAAFSTQYKLVMDEFQANRMTYLRVLRGASRLTVLDYPAALS